MPELPLCKAHMKKNRILLFTDWFVPGFRAGGPIQSIYNLVEQLGDEFEFVVFTGSKDHGCNSTYPHIPVDTLLPIFKNNKVYYSTNRQQTLKSIYLFIRAIKPDIIYLNSLFSLNFTIKPLFCLLIHFSPVRIILSPRGMISPHALKRKWIKKHLLLLFLRYTGIWKRITFHASNEREQADIKKVFGKKCAVHVIANFPISPDKISPNFSSPGSEGYRFLFFSRIHPIKGLHYALQAISTITLPLHISIIGPVEDEKYFHFCRLLIKQLPKIISVSISPPQSPTARQTLMAAHHFFLLPSESESFGHSIFEALLAGLPILISDRTPFQQVELGKYGFEFSLESIANISDAIKKAATMPVEEYVLWSSNARQEALKRYCPEKMKKKYNRLFRI